MLLEQKGQRSQVRQVFANLSKLSGQLFIGVVVTRVFMLGFRYLIIHNLSVEAYGKFSLAANLFTTLLALGHFNNGVTLSVFANDLNKRQNLQSYFSAAVCIAFVMSLASGVIIGFYLWWLGFQDLWMLISALLGFFACSLSVIMAGVYRGFFKMSKSAAIDATINLLRFVLVVGVFRFESSLSNVMHAFYLAPFAVLLLWTPDIRKNLKKLSSGASSFSFTKAHLKDLLVYSRYITAGSVAMMFLWFMCRSFLGKTSYAEAAEFDTAMLLYSIFQIAFASISTTLAPLAAKKADVEHRVRAVFGIEYFAIWLGFLTVLIGISKFSGFDVWLFSALKMREYIPSINAFYLLCFAAPFDLYFGAMYGIALGAKRIAGVVKLQLVIVAPCLLLSYVFISRFGIAGACLSYLVAYIVLSFGVTRIFNRADLSVESSLGVV